MPLSFIFDGTGLHARRVNLQSCGNGMVSVARRLARVAISSAELAFVNGCHMICNKSFKCPCQSVGLPDPDEFSVLDAI